MNARTISIFLCALLLVFLVSSTTSADTIELTGQMSSVVEYNDRYSVIVGEGVRSLTVNIPVPPSTNVFGFSQTIDSVAVKPSRQPDESTDRTDSHGNNFQVIKFVNPAPGTITFDLIASATVKVDLADPFPVNTLADITPPSAGDDYLQPTAKVQSSDPEIVVMAKSLRKDGDDEATTVRKIAQWMQNSVVYNAGITVGNDDAVTVLHNHIALCTGWTHLFLALARADGIPARFVGGVDLGGTIEVPSSTDGLTTMTLTSTCQPHSWVEVWFPGAGWVPFDPQASAGFVDSHHLKLWNGLDSTSAMKFVNWTTLEPQPNQIAVLEQESPPEISDDFHTICFSVAVEPSPLTLLTRREASDKPPTQSQ